MGIFDELKRLARPYDGEADDMYEEELPEAEAQPEPRERKTTRAESESASRRSDKVVSIHTTTQLQVVLVKPERYENGAEIADHVRERRAILMNMEETEAGVARRLLDFLSGVAYAYEGKIQRVAASTYLIAPFNVGLMGDLIGELKNSDNYHF